MNLSVLGLGFFIGFQHAFEADHLAAVSSIITRQSRLSAVARRGAFWGMGHTLTLLIFAGSAISLSWTVNEQWSAFLELCVGIMLIGLGLNVLRWIWLKDLYVPASKDRNGKAQVIVQLHERLAQRCNPRAEEAHENLPWQALLVGMVHGLAGSAALVVLAAATLQSPSSGLLYVALFGIGSILGMVLMSSLIALPLQYTTRHLSVINKVLRIGIGVATICIGTTITVESVLASSP